MKKLLLIMLVLVGIGGALFFLKSSEVKNIPTPPLSQKCGVEQCHGLDLTCGSQEVEMCTEMYTMGDGCRSYFKCGQIDGRCQQIPDERFEYCKSCVLQCISEHNDDPEKSFLCDSQCIQDADDK